MATKESHRRRAQQRQRMLAAAVRRADRHQGADSLDAWWARAQYEMRTGRAYPESAPRVGGDAA